MESKNILCLTHNCGKSPLSSSHFFASLNGVADWLLALSPKDNTLHNVTTADEMDITADNLSWILAINKSSTASFYIERAKGNNDHTKQYFTLSIVPYHPDF